MQVPQGAIRLRKDSMQAQGLVGWFPMWADKNRGTGAKLYDYSLYGQHLTNVGTNNPTFVQTPWGQAATLTDARFNWTMIPQRALQNGFLAFSLWTNITTAASVGHFRSLVHNKSADTLNEVQLGVEETGGFQCFFYQANGIANSSDELPATSLNTGWHHWLCARTYAASVRKSFLFLYKDGVQIDSADDSANDALPYAINSTDWELFGTTTNNDQGAISDSYNNPVLDLKIYTGIVFNQKMAQHLYQYPWDCVEAV